MFYLCSNEDEQELIEAENWEDPRLLMVGKGGRWNHISPGGKTKEEAYERWRILPDPCVVCGHLIESHYHNREALIQKNMCFSCNLWDDRSREVKGPNKMVVDGYFYSIAADATGGFRGHGGRKFVFKRLDNGKLVVSHNVWAGGEIPKIWRPIIKDNATLMPYDFKMPDLDGLT